MSHLHCSFHCAVLAALALSAAPRPALAPVRQDVEKPYTFNARLPETLALPGLDGKEVRLFPAGQERALLLAFWSWKDPVSRYYAPRLAELQRAHAGALSVWLVDSNADELEGANDPLARMRAVLEKEKIALPVLLDRGNALADDFGAIANAQVFLIDANRYLRYQGGIDNDPDGKRAAAGGVVESFLDPALEAVLQGLRPEKVWTRPSGRPIKRVAVHPAGAAAPGGGR